jgi:hypothetical protein
MWTVKLYIGHKPLQVPKFTKMSHFRLCWDEIHTLSSFIHDRELL